MTKVMARPALQRYAWVLHVVVTGFMAISALYLITTPDERNVGLISGGFAVMGIMLSLGGFRRGRRYAWQLMWIYPVTFGAVALSLFLDGAMGIGAYYFGLAILGLLAQLLSAAVIEAKPE